jgi:hypothetical protein
MAAEAAHEERQLAEEQRAVMREALDKARAARNSPDFTKAKQSVEDLHREAAAMYGKPVREFVPLDFSDDSRSQQSGRIPAYRGEVQQPKAKGAMPVRPDGLVKESAEWWAFYNNAMAAGQDSSEDNDYDGDEEGRDADKDYEANLEQDPVMGMGDVRMAG